MKKIFSGIAFLFVAAFSFTQVPDVMPYQGYIADASGNAYDGNYSFRFEILDAGSTVLYNSGLVTIAVSEGEYSVTLGLAPTAAFSDSLFLKNDVTQLRISFDDGSNGLETLSPNVQLYPVPYSHRALHADALSNASTYIGDSIVLRDSTGDVRLVLNPNTGTIKWMDNDTVWYSISVNSPKKTTRWENGMFIEDWYDEATGNRQTRWTDSITGKVLKETIIRKDNGVLCQRTKEYENGKLVVIDTKKGKVQTTYTFNSKGDTIGCVVQDTTPTGGWRYHAKYYDDDGTLINEQYADKDGQRHKTWDEDGTLREDEKQDHTSDEDYQNVTVHYDSTGKKIRIDSSGRSGQKIAFLDSTGKQIRYVKSCYDGNGVEVGNDSTGEKTYIDGSKLGIEKNYNGEKTETHVTVDSAGKACIEVHNKSQNKKASAKLDPKTGKLELQSDAGGVSLEMKKDSAVTMVFDTDDANFTNPIIGVFHSPSSNLVAIEGDAQNQQWNVYGNFQINGNLSKLGGTFKIDHPQYPEEKYLIHSFVESPDMMNIYNGNVVTDENGFARVKMPEYFQSLNVEFRYQLTVIGTFAQAIVKKKIEGNAFLIQTDDPNVEVSWQVTGVRNDDWARENRVVPVVDKEPEVRGTRLYSPKAKGGNK